MNPNLLLFYTSSLPWVKMSSGRFFGFLAPESYLSSANPKNVTAFSSQYKCRSVFLSRIFASKLKDMKYIFSLLRKSVIKYCLRAELQPEISNVEWSMAGCETHTKEVVSYLFSPLLFFLQFCPYHPSSTCILPSFRKKRTRKGRKGKAI